MERKLLLFGSDVKLLSFMPGVILLSLELKGSVVLLAAPSSFTVLYASEYRMYEVKTNRKAI